MNWLRENRSSVLNEKKTTKTKKLTGFKGYKFSLIITQFQDDRWFSHDFFVDVTFIGGQQKHFLITINNSKIPTLRSYIDFICLVGIIPSISLINNLKFVMKMVNNFSFEYMVDMHFKRSPTVL